MFNRNVILLGSETDCDGTSYHAHRVSVPRTLIDLDDIIVSATLSGQLSGYDADLVHRDMTFPEFKATYGPGVFRDHRHYEEFFIPSAQGGFAYVGLGARWNPWVYDDTIGTVLDHTREDEGLAYPACSTCDDPIDYCQGHGSY